MKKEVKSVKEREDYKERQNKIKYIWKKDKEYYE